MSFTRDQIIEFINDLIIEPRKHAVKWSNITKQTAHLRVGYPGQHLASLVTGVEGQRTGARGNDLSDGSEVKTCSRVDQLDKCNACGAAVLRTETECCACNSANIKRNNDSKWLFTIKSKDDLKTLIANPHLNRIVLVIDDYVNFDENDFNDIRIQVFEIYPKEERHRHFKEIMNNYYYKIYQEHKKLYPEKTPAPKNFWPYQYQFYLCNPILIFEAIIKDAYTEDPKLIVKTWIQPQMDRTKIDSILMPAKILNYEEFETLLERATQKEIEENLIKDASYKDFELAVRRKQTSNHIAELFTGINEKLRAYLDLRDTDRIASAKNKYERRRAI